MHAVLITFQSTADLDALVGPFTDYAHALATVPGLVTKTWLREGAAHVHSSNEQKERGRAWG